MCYRSWIAVEIFCQSVFLCINDAVCQCSSNPLSNKTNDFSEDIYWVSVLILYKRKKESYVSSEMRKKGFDSFEIKEGGQLGVIRKIVRVSMVICAEGEIIIIIGLHGMETVVISIEDGSKDLIIEKTSPQSVIFPTYTPFSVLEQKERRCLIIAKEARLPRLKMLIYNI